MEQTAQFPESLEAPIEKGTVIGKVTIKLNGGEIGEYNILAGETVERMNFLTALKILLEKALSTS